MQKITPLVGINYHKTFGISDYNKCLNHLLVIFSERRITLDETLDEN